MWKSKIKRPYVALITIASGDVTFAKTEAGIHVASNIVDHTISITTATCDIESKGCEYANEHLAKYRLYMLEGGFGRKEVK